jgi:hypothetical protein
VIALVSNPRFQRSRAASAAAGAGSGSPSSGPPAGGRAAGFGPLAARGLARLAKGDAEPDSLTLVLHLSAWVRTAGVTISQACDDLVELRGALLEVSGLDRASEPVPILGVDVRRDVVNLAVYLRGLIVRAARAGGLGRPEVVELALRRS